MLDIHTLERRWLKYKIKSYLPHIITLLSAVLLFIALAYTWSDSDVAVPDTKKDEPLQHTDSMTKNSAPSEENTSVVLEPSMEFVQSFQTSQNAPVQPAVKTVPTTINKPQNDAPPVPKVLSMPEMAPAKPLPPKAVSSPADKPLSLNRNDSKLDIESIERRFKETSNPSLGLFIARYHYDHGNYSEAYNVSLKTNTLNSKIEESWIIFSKSLVKLGKPDQAKKTLQLYISESNSEAARSLLDSIERGNFK